MKCHLDVFASERRTHPHTHFWHFHKAGDVSRFDVELAVNQPPLDLTHVELL